MKPLVRKCEGLFLFPLRTISPMTTLPDFHDGYFDGLYLSQHRTVHLFLRTLDGEGHTVALSKVEALQVTNLRAGTTVLDLAIKDQIKAEHIQQCYELAEADSQQVVRLLESAMEKGLVVVEMSASYGAALTALCAGVDINRGHVLPQTQ